MKCKCRNCGTTYDPERAKADLRGYCQQACMHEKAKALGYTKASRTTEYRTLQNAGAIGDAAIDTEPELNRELEGLKDLLASQTPNMIYVEDNARLIMYFSHFKATLALTDIKLRSRV